MEMFKDCSGCGDEIDSQNTHGLCIKCLRVKRKFDKEEKAKYKKLDRSTRNVLTYLKKFIVTPTDQIIADQSKAWNADKDKVRDNLHLMRFGTEDLNFYYAQFHSLIYPSTRKRLTKSK